MAKMQHFIAFWNLENLFAPANHPDRIPWVEKQVKADLKGWTKALYQRKLSQLSSVICQMKGGAGPDILGVCEVEDLKVLKDLAATLNSGLSARRYDVVYATADLSSRGIDTAFLFDKKVFTVDKKFVFNHFVMRRTGTRDILQATFRSVGSGNDLVVMANHWPSRSGGGGPERSAGFRATAGETLAYWHQRVFDLAPKKDRTPVLAMGDMNDDPWDSSLTINALATRERGDVQRGTSAKFYNLSWEYLESPATDNKGKSRVLEGTLYFRSNGNVFDQILANRPLIDTKKDSGFKLVPDTAGIIAVPEMVSHKKGEGPIRFGLPKGNAATNVNRDGYSDHFPVGVFVREV